MSIKAQQLKFYEKSKLAGAISFVVSKSEDSGDGDPMLRLHECLATISVKRKKGEVIACHIAAASGSDRRSRLYMSRNDQWGDQEKRHVGELLKILGEMRGASEPDAGSHGQETLKRQLQDEVYNYCRAKVQCRIDKMLETIQSVQRNHLRKSIRKNFPHDKTARSRRALAAEMELIRADLSRLSEDFKSTRSLAEKSNSCREYARKWDNDDLYKGALEIVREKFPCIDKRLRKVASYSRSIDVLSEWAAGVGEYRNYKKTYPVPTDVIYSKPTKVPTDQVMKITDWKVAAKQHYPNHATKRNLSKLKNLNPFVKLAKKPSCKSLYLHAEMHVVEDLLGKAPSAVDGASQQGIQQYYIGISKLCCYLCYNCIRAVNEKRQHQLHINVKGTHNKLYSTWLIPPTISLQELEALEEKLDTLNKDQLRGLVKRQDNGTDESGPVSSLSLLSLAAAR